MLYALLKSVHLLSLMAWVGGMVFAHFFLRPAVAELAPAVRLALMDKVLARFFGTVQWLVVSTLVSGGWLMGRSVRQTEQAGVGLEMPLEWLVMAILGSVMAGVFVLIRFVYFRQFSRQVQQQSWPEAAKTLSRVRGCVLLNLGLALVIVVLTQTGLAAS